MTGWVIVMLPLLLSLGNWQVQRGAFKRDLESQYLEKLTELPKPVSVDVMSQPFQALKLNGRYQPETFLVDNQVSKGKNGYWVFQVFDEASIGRVLINRGFIASETRDRLPQIPMPEETVGMRAIVAGAWPAELRLEAGQPGVLEPAPFASRLSDDTHRGYAATWFGLATALVLGYLFLGFSASAKVQRAKNDDLGDH